MDEVLWHEGPVVTGGGHPFEFYLPTAARDMRRRDDEIAIAHVHLDLIAKSAFFDERLGNPYSPRIADWDDIDFHDTHRKCNYKVITFFVPIKAHGTSTGSA
jgi:hypothetical protein